MLVLSVRTSPFILFVHAIFVKSIRLNVSGLNKVGMHLGCQVLREITRFEALVLLQRWFVSFVGAFRCFQFIPPLTAD